jgi:hypothetical protein
VKRFENIFRILFLLFSLPFGSVTIAQEADSLRQQSDTVVDARTQALLQMDSVEVGLLTCSPHNEVYSLYGHTALHWHDLSTGRHWVFNYGVFDYRKPHFVWRFMMGQTDYKLECTSDLEAWCHYYHKWGSSVEEQVLDLTAIEKLRLQYALAENLKQPVYRYNFFYDNCSTRPRNIIEQCMEGNIVYAQDDDGKEAPSFRQMIHALTEEHPWAAFGNDLLLGFKADAKTTQRERQFLPANLSRDFERATVIRNGQQRPLVLRHITHVAQGIQTVEKEFPLSPLACTLLLLIISLGIMAYELWAKTTWVWWDALLMLASALAGCILTLMLFSEHPATSTNLQVLVLNPLALLFIPAVVRRRPTRWFTISAILILLFFIGGFWQDYAEGMEFLALSLLTRYWIHRNDK